MFHDNKCGGSMAADRRRFKRYPVFLVVNFRHLYTQNIFSYGITDNFSDDGISLETQSYDCTPGDMLEIHLKDPQNGLSACTNGKVMWKYDGTYECLIGVKLKESSDETESRFAELLSSAVEVTGEKAAPDNGDDPAEDHKRKKQRPGRKKRLPAVLLLALTVIALAGLIARNQYNDNNMPAVIAKIQGIFAYKKPAEKAALLPDDPQPLSISTSDSAPRDKDLRSDTTDSVSNNTPAVVAENQGIFAVRGLAEEVTLLPDTPQPLYRISTVDSQLRDKELKSDNTDSVSDEIIRDVMFDYNSDVVKPREHTKIREISEALLNIPDSMIKLTGHTDSIGSNVHNLDLTVRRSFAVREAFIQQGVPDNKIGISILGYSNPAASSDILAGRVRNRRVDMVVQLQE
jgi:outer membrane protein OmpA-like peptidoglycan-associated protein